MPLEYQFCSPSCPQQNDICFGDDERCTGDEDGKCNAACLGNYWDPNDELFRDEDPFELSRRACCETVSIMDGSSTKVPPRIACHNTDPYCASHDCSSSSLACDMDLCETETNCCEDGRCSVESRCHGLCETEMWPSQSNEPEDEGYSQEPITTEAGASYNSVPSPSSQPTMASLGQQPQASLTSYQGLIQTGISKQRTDLSSNAQGTPMSDNWNATPLNPGNDTATVSFLQGNVSLIRNTQNHIQPPAQSQSGEATPDTNMMQRDIRSAPTSPNEHKSLAAQKLALRQQSRLQEGPKSSAERPKKSMKSKKAKDSRKIYYCRYPWCTSKDTRKKDELCSYTATDASNRKKHERTHWSTKPYACYYPNECGARMARSDDIKRHLESGGCNAHKVQCRRQNVPYPLPQNWEHYRYTAMQKIKAEEDKIYWPQLEKWMKDGNPRPTDYVNEDGTEPCYVYAPVDSQSQEDLEEDM